MKIKYVFTQLHQRIKTPNSASHMYALMHPNPIESTTAQGLALFQFVQVLKPCEHNLFTRLFNLAGEKDFVEDGVDLYPQLVYPYINVSIFVALSVTHLVEIEH